MHSNLLPLCNTAGPLSNHRIRRLGQPLPPKILLLPFPSILYSIALSPISSIIHGLALFPSLQSVFRPKWRFVSEVRVNGNVDRFHPSGRRFPAVSDRFPVSPGFRHGIRECLGVSGGCKYEERDEQREGVKTTEQQKIEPTTPEPSRPRLCLKRKRVATQTFHHLEQSASLRCKNAEMSKKKTGKKIQTAKLCVSASSACLASTENKAKIFDEHCKYAYHTRNLIRAAEGIFSELEESKNEKFPWRNGDHQSWTEKPKTTSHLVAMKEWRMLLEGVGSSSSSSSLVMEEECCLERESEPLRNLVSVFIENVRGVQGDRCYSQWKGSVLDSVIGAFLAQNTSDQMSSSAFMSLAARFPLKPRYRLRERVENNEFSGVVDCLHWDAVRQAKVQDVSKAISPRGMHNRLAKRIKALLNWLVKEHHGLNLEELRHAAPEIIIKFLQKFTGIGVKSVECVRLLALTQKAFPVDTHVARVTIRLGWIPLPPVLYEHQTRVSDRYRRVIKLIHQYLWSLLQELDHETLYQLHCQMITFGKVFCTNNNPNCSVCPMRENCKYYKSRVERSNQAKTEKCKSCNVAEACTSRCSANDIEDYNTGRKKPVEKRMKHVVYELPDKHPLLASVRTRVVEDSSPYLLVVWEPAEIINHSMSEQSEASSEGKKLGSLCRQPVAGTIMIPCRTALGGSFPLNGTFFQINEMFADHKTSESPLKVPRGCLAMLPKKVLHCGTSITEIVRGLSGEDICRCFKEGYICTRGFDQETGFPKPLNDRFQLLRPAS